MLTQFRLFMAENVYCYYENQAVGSAALPPLLNVTRAFTRVQQSSTRLFNNTQSVVPEPGTLRDVTRVKFAIQLFKFVNEKKKKKMYVYILLSVLPKAFSRPSGLSGSLSTAHFEEHLVMGSSALSVDHLTPQESTPTTARSHRKVSKISRSIKS
jgi:hypothetical protein